jgi:hypothetical protein
MKCRAADPGSMFAHESRLCGAALRRTASGTRAQSTGAQTKDQHGSERQPRPRYDANLNLPHLRPRPSGRGPGQMAAARPCNRSFGRCRDRRRLPCSTTGQRAETLSPPRNASASCSSRDWFAGGAFEHAGCLPRRRSQSAAGPLRSPRWRASEAGPHVGAFIPPNLRDALSARLFAELRFITCRRRSRSCDRDRRLSAAAISCSRWRVRCRGRHRPAGSTTARWDELLPPPRNASTNCSSQGWPTGGAFGHAGCLPRRRSPLSRGLPPSRKWSGSKAGSKTGAWSLPEVVQPSGDPACYRPDGLSLKFKFIGMAGTAGARNGRRGQY